VRAGGLRTGQARPFDYAIPRRTSLSLTGTAVPVLVV